MGKGLAFLRCAWSFAPSVISPPYGPADHLQSVR